jgi:hypothetical protein
MLLILTRRLWQHDRIIIGRDINKHCLPQALHERDKKISFLRLSHINGGKNTIKQLEIVLIHRVVVWLNIVSK